MMGVGIVGVTCHHDTDGKEKSVKVLGRGQRGGDADDRAHHALLKTRMSRAAVGRSTTSLESRGYYQVCPDAFSRTSRCHNSTCAHGGKHTL
jgi:hypothetical protein